MKSCKSSHPVKNFVARSGFFLYIHHVPTVFGTIPARANHSQIVVLEGLGPSNAANLLEEHRAHGRNFGCERYFAFVGGCCHR